MSNQKLRMNPDPERIQEALRESEVKYRTLTENITFGIFRSTPGPKGNFIEVNTALVKMLGYEDKKELIALNVADVYRDPNERIKFSTKISKERSVKNEVLYLKKKDGTPIIVSVTAIAVKDEDGKIPYFDGIVEDISERKRAEEELNIQRVYLERLFNSTPQAIVLHDNDDIVVNVNDGFIKIFGYSRDEAIGMPINQLVASEKFQTEASALSDKVIHGKRVEVETQRQRKDGTVFDVSVLGAPILRDGKQIGVYAIYRDMTESKKAEEELLLHKTYLEKLFNCAPEAIVLHDIDDLIVDVNDEFIKTFGYSREEAKGKPINDLVASGEYKEEAEKVSNLVIRGEKVAMETKRKRKDGTLMDVSILGAPIIHDGKQIGDYAIYRDITERKKAEEDLLIQKAYLERLFNSAPQAIVLHDNDDMIVNVNDEFTRTFGYSREEAVGRPINELVASEDLLAEALRLSDKVIHGERVEVETRRKRKDGSLMDVLILGAPIVHDGKQIGVYAIYQDITERKRAEEIRIRSREEARMARNIQMHFLPESDPEVSGYDIAGKSVPALNVGGDYYDFIWLDQHRLAISLGDVSGKGLAASLVMANLQATIRGQALFNAAPEKCLEGANKLLFKSIDSRTFVTLFYGILDTRKHILSYSNAGHEMPIVFPSSGKPYQLKDHGLALGLKKDVIYERDEMSINPGDRLLICTDGVREAMNRQMQEFGEARITDILRARDGAPAREMIDHIFEAIKLHRGDADQNDDSTVVLLNREL